MVKDTQIPENDVRMDLVCLS